MPRKVKEVTGAARRVGDGVRDGVKDLVAPKDGRASRWDEHREARRGELVEAAVAAIDEHGPTASVAQISTSAGVSRPVLYRYFADKEDLYRAVGAWGAQQVI